MASKVPEEWQFLQKLTKEELHGLLFSKCIHIDEESMCMMKKQKRHNYYNSYATGSAACKIMTIQYYWCRPGIIGYMVVSLYLLLLICVVHYTRVL